MVTALLLLVLLVFSFATTVLVLVLVLLLLRVRWCPLSPITSSRTRPGCSRSCISLEEMLYTRIPLLSRVATHCN